MMPKFVEFFADPPLVRAKAPHRDVQVTIGNHITLVGSVDTLLELAAEIRDQFHLVEMELMMKEGGR